MTTPRTIKASEVVKGMRVRVEESLGGRTTQVTEGPVMADAIPYHAEYFDLELDGAMIGIAGDHPVTVLAEPEPEWVEGAWYWVEKYHRRWLVRRVTDGWARSSSADGSRPWWTDAQDSDVTVLGRVLIVDWPGDEHASNLVETYGAGLTWDDFECSPLQKVADAIRTQGGVR